MARNVLYFLSDAHLGAEPRPLEIERERQLRRFLELVPERAQALYIVGDLFDFWFEYRSSIPRRYFAILATLAQVRAAGVPIVYLGGNHDFWLGSFITEDLGIEVHDGAVTVEAQGRRLWVHHGDGLIGGDHG